MAMAWVWSGMVIVSLLFGITHGTLDAVANAALEGADSAVQLCFSMAGIMIEPREAMSDKAEPVMPAKKVLSSTFT